MNMLEGVDRLLEISLESHETQELGVLCLRSMKQGSPKMKMFQSTERSVRDLEEVEGA